MKIVICVKQVPDTSDIKWTENNTIQREGLESILNPYDAFAIESALKIKKSVENVEIKMQNLHTGLEQICDLYMNTEKINIQLEA